MHLLQNDLSPYFLWQGQSQAVDGSDKPVLASLSSYLNLGAHYFALHCNHAGVA